MLDDYIAYRSGIAIKSMTQAALNGDTSQATVHAAQLDMLTSILNDMASYCTQEMAMRHGS